MPLPDGRSVLLATGGAVSVVLLIKALQLRLASGSSSALDAVLRRILAALPGPSAAAPAAGGGGLQLPGVSRAAALADGLEHLIGNTPLMRIRSLSEATGCEILAKAEFLNPGGSVKDRVALEILQEALAEGRLAPGGLVTEGTVGSTGVSLAMCAAAFGCRAAIYIPDDAAIEKAQLLKAYGAEVVRLRPVSITHPDHFVNVARRRAASEDNAIFADQFETPANFRAHLRTGQEIWEQTGGRLDAFVSGAGTGGTIAGVGAALKRRDPSVRAYLADPPGSSLYNKVTRGVLYTREEAEGKRLRHPFDTITEGVGLNRLTQNFSRARIDGAFKASDAESVEMAAYLLRNDGLFVGSSSAVNCVGAVKAARALGPGHTIVTMLCDGGQRHLSKFHSPEYLAEWGLAPTHTGRGLDFIREEATVPTAAQQRQAAALQRELQREAQQEEQAAAVAAAQYEAEHEHRPHPEEVHRERRHAGAARAR